MAYEVEIQAARERLRAATADLELTQGEERFVRCMARMDRDTIDQFIGIVAKARRAFPLDEVLG